MFFWMILSMTFFFFIFFLKNMILFSWEFFFMKSLSLSLFLFIDWISVSFFLVVVFISLLIFYYCNEYMKSDKYFNRFMIILFLFVISMVILIFSPNLISMIIGWDGLGVTSFCLVIFFQNFSSLNAGILTFVMNRMGDSFMMMSMWLILNILPNSSIFMKNFNKNDFLFFFLFSFLLILTAFTKSAQIPFSSWLPAAMAAPTPVSSLVHSSTLVTAGIYLIIRYTYFMNFFSKNLMFNISLLTMLMASILALFEFDMKKIIAFSTLSQLGFIFFSISLFYLNQAFFHLLCHAMFKALLFMCSGYMIHSCFNNQDIRNLGLSISSNPKLSSSLVISSMSMMGLPFLTGYYSKDLIIENSYFWNFFFQPQFFFSLSVLLTCMYTLRMLNFCFMEKKSLHSFSNNEMDSSIFFLSWMSIFFGSTLSWIILEEKICIISFFLKTMFLMYFFFIFFSNLNLNFLTFYLLIKFNSNFWFFDFFSKKFIPNFFIYFSKNMKLIDFGWFEMIYLFFYKNMNSKMIFYKKNTNPQFMIFFFLTLMIFLFYMW